MQNEVSRSIADLVDIVLVLKQAEGGKEPGDIFCCLIQLQECFGDDDEDLLEVWYLTTAWVDRHMQGILFGKIMENFGPASPKLGDRDLARPGSVDFVEYPSYHLQQAGDDVMMMVIVMVMMVTVSDVC